VTEHWVWHFDIEFGVAVRQLPGAVVIDSGVRASARISVRRVQGLSLRQDAVVAENPGRGDPLDPHCGGLAWSGWHGLDATAARGLVPREAGVYRLRCGGCVIYVGISNRLSLRLGGLRRARSRPPLYRGHSAAACVAGFENRNEVVEVSWAPTGDIDRRVLMGLEVDLIANCRAWYGDSPACQFHGVPLE
jgi:hypothetical protein